MAWSAVSSAVITIGKLLKDEAVFLWGVEKQVDRLLTELKWMESLLREADAKQHEDERIRLWVAEIRELAYDAEDVIEDFVFRIGSKKKGGLSGCIKRSACILNEGWTLHETRSKIEEIFEKITDLIRRLQAYGVKGLRDGDGSSSSIARRELRRPYPHIIDQSIVGLDDDIEKLVSELVEGTQCKVVSIWGMGGLGKTTLAKKLYHHSRVTSHFEHSAFVFVSQQFQTRKVWEDILSGLGKFGENDRNDEALARNLSDLLKAEKYLVILDDVWSTEAWDRLKPAFPVARSIHSNSKILLTSRTETIVYHADASVYSYELPILNPQESWELFEKIAFPPSDSTDKTVDGEIKELRQDKGKRRANDTVDGEIKELAQDKGKRRADDAVDYKKKELGKVMVEQCGGLPLAIVVLGGILAKKSLLNEWDRVSENVKSYLNRSKVQGQGTREVLALSYDDLPAYLRSCFLYLSHFPEDYVIRVDRLIQLWVAEGIVSSKEEEEDGEWGVAEDVAEHYLTELAERCMIQVRSRDVVTSKVKTFQMHDLIRDLCLSKAKEENFVFIVDDSNARSLSRIREVRRVSTHKFFWTQYIRCPHLRSLSFFNANYLGMLFEVETPSAFIEGPFSRLRCFWDIWAEYIRFLKARGFWVHIFINLKLLRVLNYEVEREYAGCKLIGDIGNLIHLRFLSLQGLHFRSTPSSLGNLRCLQTLDLLINEHHTIHVPNVIWRMEELRHLYLPEDCDDKTKLRLDTLRKLLTLVNFNTKNCYLKDLSNMTKIRKLMIRGPFKIEDFNEELDKNPPIIQSKYFHTLTIINWEMIDARHLTHLLSSCGTIRKLKISAEIRKLPEHLPSNLAYIYFRYCQLQEDPMPTLEKLQNLRFLEVDDFSFEGKQMCCSAKGFPKLESLILRGLWYLEQWKVGEGAMPCLRRLEIQDCITLEMLPDELRFIKTLQELEIGSMPKEFHDKVVQGGQDSDKVQVTGSYSRTYKRRYTTNSEGGDGLCIWI